MDNLIQPTYKVITWNEFKERFEPTFEMPFEDFYDELAEIRLYEANEEGDVHFATDFMLNEYLNAVIDGNLIVDGNIQMNHDEGVGGFVFVNGNVSANSVVLCGMSSMHIKGNVDVKHGILGCYGDNGGYLTVSGETTTPVVINDTYFNMSFHGAVNAIVIDNSYGELESDYDGETFAEALKPELVEDDEVLETYKTWEYLQQGKAVLNDSILKTCQNVSNAECNFPQAVLLPITVKEAIERFPLLNQEINSYGDQTDYVMVCEGDAFFPGDLEIDFHLDEWFKPNDGDGATGIIFNGNLTVEGSIINMEGDYGPFLLVLGDLKAKNIDKGGSEFCITGDCEVTNTIYGYYNHGILSVGGKIKATFLINDDHCIEGCVHPDTITVNNYSDYDDFDYYCEDIPKMFVDEVLNRDGDAIDITKFIQRLNEGKRVLKPGAKPARVIVEEHIKELAENGEEITELDLTEKKLKQFPKDILRIQSLKVLNLSDNPIEKIPEDIYKLKNLEELYLYNCSLEELPESLGNLTQLRVLDISRNNVYKFNYTKDDSSEDADALTCTRECYGLELPSTVEKLINLKVLKINDNKGFKLQPELAKIQLEELEAHSCTNDHSIEFPEFICKLTSLKKLDLSRNSFKQIPESFLNLVNLEELNLDSSIGYLKTLPDLSLLPKLRILSANGNGYPYYRSQNILKDLFTISTLEELNIDRHGLEIEYYDLDKLSKLKENLADDLEGYKVIEERFHAIPEDDRPDLMLRDRLKAEHLQGIGNLKHLKVLDLSFNSLEELPEDFWELKELQSINLEYNCLPQALRERIAQAFPQTKIDFRNQRVKEIKPEHLEDESFKAMNQLVKQGNDNRYPATYEEAIAYYDQALEFFKNGKVTDEYNLIYIHYSKMWVYSHMVWQSQELTEEKKLQYKKLCVVEAQCCLDLVPPNMNVWHFTDVGQFHEEVIRYACNCIAWDLYETFDEPKKLEEALRIIDRGMAFANEPAYYYIRDTKVRILLKLGMVDDAYTLVQKTLNFDPDFEDFQDFKNNPDYLAWIQNKGL